MDRSSESSFKFRLAWPTLGVFCTGVGRGRGRDLLDSAGRRWTSSQGPAGCIRPVWRKSTTGSSADQPDSAAAKVSHHTGLKALDREINRAQGVYLRRDGRSAQGVRNAIESLEALLDETPPGDPLLSEINRRFPVFDEAAAKILGPVKHDPDPAAASAVFEILERRRAFRLRTVLKQCGPLHFYDQPAAILDEETKLLEQLTKQEEASASRTPTAQESRMRTRLAEVKKALHKSSARSPLLRGGNGLTLDAFRSEGPSKDEVVVDFNLFPDRMVVGVISKEDARYLQFDWIC